MKNTYYDLSLDELAGFYYYLNKYIEHGILSKAMYHEIQLIEQVALDKKIPLTWLYYKGSMVK
nr:hypothetical protein [Lysinibacillus timonensis]